MTPTQVLTAQRSQVSGRTQLAGLLGDVGRHLAGVAIDEAADASEQL